MTAFDALSVDFLTEFLVGLRLNLLSALMTLVLFLPVAFVLALGLRAGPRPLRLLLRGIRAVMHATPVFIAMFFLAGMLGDGTRLPPLLGHNLPLVILILGSAPFVLSYGINLFDAMLRKRAEGDHRAAWLILPGIGRATQVLISTSCLGAAIGVPEAMSVVMYTSEQIPDPANRMVFFAVCGVLFILAQRLFVLPIRISHGVVDRRLRRVAAAQT